MIAMTPFELILYGSILMVVTLGAFRLLNRVAPSFMGNQFPEREEREERERVLTERVAELERKNKSLELTVNVLTEQLDKSNARIGQLKAEVSALEREVLALQRSNGQQKITPVKMVVLGIWPVAPGQASLDQQAEADALYDAGYTYVALRGARATRAGVIWEVDRLHPTILQVGGHGDKDGIMLSDGIAEPGWWAELVTGREIDLVVLLSCDSSQQDEYNISDALIRARVNAVISCDDKIGDIDAVRFTQMLYSRLAEGALLSEAVRRAKLAISRKSGEMIRLREGK
jgi:hypothetical protein